MVPRGLGRIPSGCCYGSGRNSAVGSVSVVAEASVPETGLAATGGVGSVTVLAGCKHCCYWFNKHRFC